MQFNSMQYHAIPWYDRLAVVSHHISHLNMLGDAVARFWGGVTSSICHNSLCAHNVQACRCQWHNGCKNVMLLQLWRHMDGAMAAATMAFNVTRVDVGHTWDDVSWVTRFTTWGFFLPFSWRRRWLSRWWWFLGWFHWYTKTRLINWVEWETQAWLNILFCCLWVEKSILESSIVRQIDWRWIIQQVASGAQVTSAPEAAKSSTACFHIDNVTLSYSVYSL